MASCKVQLPSNTRSTIKKPKIVKTSKTIILCEECRQEAAMPMFCVHCTRIICKPEFVDDSNMCLKCAKQYACDLCIHANDSEGFYIDARDNKCIFVGSCFVCDLFLCKDHIINNTCPQCHHPVIIYNSEYDRKYKQDEDFSVLL